MIILESVGALSKEEWVNMSESLIISLKRNFVLDLETVGEDIDVTIISRGDGFIWKKLETEFSNN